MLRLRDARALLGALQAELALVFALVQVTDVGLFSCPLERSPDPIVWRGLRAVRRKCELRIGTEKCSDLFSLHLVHVIGVGFESRV